MKTPRKLKQLITDVEDLLAGLNDEHGPEVEEMRSRVEETISQAKRALSKQGRTTAAQVKQYAGMADDYITGYPRMAFASGILIGGVLGFLAASAHSDA
jgi:ElaB/YqjD/DUF883 family membrane-anchored ribosome-binding protein